MSIISRVCRFVSDSVSVIAPALPQLAEPGAVPQSQQAASRGLVPVNDLLDARENTEHLTDIRLDMLEGCGLIIRFRVHNGYDIPSPARKIVKSMRGVGSPPGTGDGRTLTP